MTPEQEKRWTPFILVSVALGATIVIGGIVYGVIKLFIYFFILAMFGQG